MKEKFMRFMQGRYGMDHLGRSVVGVAILAFVLSFFFENAIFPLLAWAGIIYAYFRMFSRNIYKRSAENQAFLARTYKLRCFFARQKNLLAQRKTHHIYKCPTCKQKIRVPKMCIRDSPRISRLSPDSTTSNIMRSPKLRHTFF